MLHLDTDRLAALADEAPTGEETAHLAVCLACRRERDAFTHLLALARQEGAAGLAGDVAAKGPPLASWDVLATTLRAEGLMRPAAASTVDRPAFAPDFATADVATADVAMATVPVRRPPAIALGGWRRVAASLALLVGGAALGRASAPTTIVRVPVAVATPAVAPGAQAAAQVAAAPPTPAKAPSAPAAAATVPAPAAERVAQGLSDTLPVFGEPDARLAAQTDDAAGFRSAQEAMQVIARTQRDYTRAAAWLADNDSTAVRGTPQALRTRLAALDEVLPKLRDALHAAPQDPVLNQYYLTATDVRESTLRQLGRVLPAGVRLNGY